MLVLNKYVNVDYYFINNRAVKLKIQVHFIFSNDQLDDVLTKPLPYALLAHIQSKLQVEPSLSV
jgi:hypothetical protein